LRPEYDRSRPAGNGAASKLSNGNRATVGQTADHFMQRMLEDCMAEATRSYWLRRARTFDGVGTPACREIAQACRNRAALADYEDFREIVAQVVNEVSEDFLALREAS
jgi:hypothetical protein